MKFKTILGQVARGKNFFPRPAITNKIWDKLGDGSNLLISAPRRVGKSSILFHLLDEPRKNYIIVYYTSESVNSEDEFFEKLFNHIINKLNKFKEYQEKLKVLSKKFLKSIKSIGKDGIEFQHANSISYYNEVMNLIKNLDLNGKKIVVLIDEFSQTIENIIRDENVGSAIHFLETNREIRQIPKDNNNLQFIYSGSIGLENIVSSINSIKTINDLASIKVNPLNRDEAKMLVENILDDSGVTFAKGAFEYLSDEIEWLIPFYFQMILDEIVNILEEKKSKKITKNDLDRAIENILKIRIYFEHWFTRLRNAFKGNDFSFVKEVLNTLSEKMKLPSSEILNIAVKLELENSYKNLLNTLKHDGYINNENDVHIYRFNSPILRKWWEKNVAN